MTTVRRRTAAFSCKADYEMTMHGIGDDEGQQSDTRSRLDLLKPASAAVYLTVLSGRVVDALAVSVTWL